MKLRFKKSTINEATKYLKSYAKTEEMDFSEIENIVLNFHLFSESGDIKYLEKISIDGWDNFTNAMEYERTGRSAEDDELEIFTNLAYVFWHLSFNAKAKRTRKGYKTETEVFNANL